ncbi:hypothetical protein HY463_01820 [Candidatus Peregrinibacteria bacterium]|nr:hypothetical protein [Candidatus Peregrinibacteria bacterium]
MKEELQSLSRELTPEERIRKLESDLAMAARATARTRKLVYALLGAIALGGAYAGRKLAEGAALGRLDEAMDGIEESEQARLAEIDETLSESLRVGTENAASLKAQAQDRYTADMDEYMDSFAQRKDGLAHSLRIGMELSAIDLESELAENESARQDAIAALNLEYDQKGAEIAESVSAEKDRLRAKNEAEYAELQNKPSVLASERDRALREADDGLNSYANAVTTKYALERDAISVEKAGLKGWNSMFEGILFKMTGARRYQDNATITDMLDCSNDPNSAAVVVDCQNGAPQENEELNGPYNCSENEALTGVGVHTLRVPGYAKFDADAFCENVDGPWAVKLQPL